jgi:aspartate racemase
MKTIGILGGIGPQATMDFEQRIHSVARQLIPPKMNQGYPPMVTMFLRHPPILVKDGAQVEPLTLDPRVLDAARKLGEWADLLVIPSNTPHLFLDEVSQAAGCEIVSIVEVTMAELERRGAQRAGLIGLGIPQIYAERFAGAKLEMTTAPEELRSRLDAAILRVMEGTTTPEDPDCAREPVRYLRDTGVPVIVLGCTEIPLLLGEDANAGDLVNPAQLLAQAVVRRAIET